MYRQNVPTKDCQQLRHLAINHISVSELTSVRGCNFICFSCINLNVHILTKEGKRLKRFVSSVSLRLTFFFPPIKLMLSCQLIKCIQRKTCYIFMWMDELCKITVFQESYIVYIVNEEIENGQIFVQDIA